MRISDQVKKDITNLVNLNLSNWQLWLIDEDREDGEDNDYSYNDITFGIADNGEEWGYQTGDNSFTGGAYSFKNWVVVSFSSSTTSEELLEEIFSEVESLEIYGG